VVTRPFGMRPSVYVNTGTIGWKQLFEQAVCMCPACTYEERTFGRRTVTVSGTLQERGSGGNDVIDNPVGRSHLRAEQSAICISQSSTDFTAHVHLYKSELLHILPVQSVEIGR
jgi:hypothetical protein